MKRCNYEDMMRRKTALKTEKEWVHVFSEEN